ncbi:MAG: TIGR04282 family arsenosugar biosynthesis glycosyltransferase [Thermodesulfobacteriota bacterium]|nr:TIGR04282 family arsenosugar biosynthesis glycosyltransferase [Thermodesulfobacteriota bacterium]
MTTQSEDRNMLLLFTRYPRAGETKTRLIPVLGEQGAAYLQRTMSEKTFAMARKLSGRRKISLQVHYTGGSKLEMQQWLNGKITCIQQVGGSLGDRLIHAFRAAFAGRMSKVIAIGTDCPALTPEIIENGFQNLADYDLVLGPALDGGYYLIGLKTEEPALFSQIPWGMDQVLNQTLKRAEMLGLSVHLLEPLADVDRPEDLCHIATIQRM